MPMNEALVKSFAQSQKSLCVSAIMSHANLSGMDAENMAQVQAMYDHIIQQIIDVVLNPTIDEIFTQIRAGTVTCPAGTGTIA